MITLFVGLAREAGINTTVVAGAQVTGGRRDHAAKGQSYRSCDHATVSQEAEKEWEWAWARTARRKSDGPVLQVLMERAKEATGDDLAGLLDRMESG